MPTFEYRYTDENEPESPRIGKVEAADREEALWQLASQGLDPNRVTLTETARQEDAAPQEPGPAESVPETHASAEDVQADVPSPGAAAEPSRPFGRRLSDADAETLADELSSLARSGLPLPGGLRALAEELGSGPTSSVLLEMAEWIENGHSLDNALERIGERLPGHLRAIISAGATSGRLSEVLERYVDLRRDQAELRHRMWLAVAYPFALLALLIAIVTGLARFVVPHFDDLFDDFSVALPDLTQAVIWFSYSGIWYLLGTVAVVVVLFLFAISRHAPLWMRLCVFEIPIFGAFWRWSHLMPFAQLMSLLVEHGMTLPAALRATGDGVADRHLAAACHLAADEVEAGSPLGEGLAAARMFPTSAMPLLDWGGRFDSLPVALKFIAESFEGRTRLQVEMAQIVALPTVLMIVMMAGIMLLSLFLPMINLIECLSH